METKQITLKQVLIMIYNELKQINNLPPDVLLTAGVHVGRAFGICCDALNGIERQEQEEAMKKAEEEGNIVELPLEENNDA